MLSKAKSHHGAAYLSLNRVLSVCPVVKTKKFIIMMIMIHFIDIVLFKNKFTKCITNCSVTKLNAEGNKRQDMKKVLSNLTKSLFHTKSKQSFRTSGSLCDNKLH